MHGILYVWCGPFQRWRERYGIIDNGHLDIYPSVDSKSTNLLESHYIACANVTPVSSSALEWIIHSPGKSSAYFKVTTPEERRRWLKLLGSAKACIADSSALMARYDSDTGKSISNQQLNSQYEEVLTKIDYKEYKTEEATVKEDVAIEYSSIRAIISLSEDIKSELCDVQKHCKEGLDHVNITYLQTKEKEISNLWTNVKGRTNGILCAAYFLTTGFSMNTMTSAKDNWFHGRASRAHVERLVRDAAVDGSFAVRCSDTMPGAFSLSLLYSERVFTYRVIPVSGDKLAVQTHSGVQSRKFTCIDELVQQYSTPKNGLACALKNPVGFQSKPSLPPRNIPAADTNQSLQINNETGKQPSAPPPNSPTSAQVVDLSDDKLCKICMDSVINIYIEPCGHVCLCDTCAGRVDVCPICRISIISKKQAFLP